MAPTERSSAPTSELAVSETGVLAYIPGARSGEGAELTWVAGSAATTGAGDRSPGRRVPKAAGLGPCRLIA